MKSKIITVATIVAFILFATFAIREAWIRKQKQKADNKPKVVGYLFYGKGVPITNATTFIISKSDDGTNWEAVGTFTPEVTNLSSSSFTPPTNFLIPIYHKSE